MNSGDEPKAGQIYVARETAHADRTSLSLAQVLVIDSERYARKWDTVGCYQPSVLRDCDRLVFDLGRARLLHLKSLVLGLTVLGGPEAATSTASEVHFWLE